MTGPAWATPTTPASPDHLRAPLIDRDNDPYHGAATIAEAQAAIAAEHADLELDHLEERRADRLYCHGWPLDAATARAALERAEGQL